MEQVLLSTAYLGAIQYFSKFQMYDKVVIEQFETYPKQTYRNRCSILAANGPLDLTIPVIKTNGNNTTIKNIKIDYSTRWQSNHWRSLVSAYNSSPFFEYYAPEIEPFYKLRFENLLDFNLQMTKTLLDLLDIQVEIELTAEFEKNIYNCTDFRNAIHPKPHKNLADSIFKIKEYTQCFSNEHGFVPNLSIVDLLFNLGPESGTFLEGCCILD